MYIADVQPFLQNITKIVGDEEITVGFPYKYRNNK